MKHTISIPDIKPEDIEATIEQLRQVVRDIRSWHWIQGVLHVTIEEKQLVIREKTIKRIVYHDEKSWFAQYHRDFNRWTLTACRGDWLDKIEPQNPDEKTG